MLRGVAVAVGLVGWYGFRSEAVLLAGWLLYVFAKLLNWFLLDPNDKIPGLAMRLWGALRSLAAGAAGCVVGLFVPAPWYVCGLLAMTFLHGGAVLCTYVLSGLIRSSERKKRSD